MAFRIAYAAGHSLSTAGKRLPKALDKDQTREWTLNDRVARYFAEAANTYEGVELLRLDDPSGKAGNPVAERAGKANVWGADLLIEFHHNAGANLTKAGGIVAFSHKEKTKGATFRDAIYAACIAAGGLKGNRASPKKAKAYTILKKFNGAGVLLECGFMDSKADAPVILTEAYSRLVAYATMEAVATVAGLKKKGAVCRVELPVLVMGDTGDPVKAMQLLLAGYGYDCKGTGKFGTVTLAALQDFQKQKGLATSGKCGEKTWSALLGVKV